MALSILPLLTVNSYKNEPSSFWEELVSKRTLSIDLSSRYQNGITSTIPFQKIKPYLFYNKLLYNSLRIGLQLEYIRA